MRPLSCIVAMAENGVIGRDNDLPWRLSADLKRFKQLTMGHPILMGRKTWDSIGRPLPGRTSIVITRNADLQIPGAIVARSLEDAVERCAAAEEVFVIGGRSIFEAAWPHVTRLHLTRVHADVPGDVRFPPVDLSAWRRVESERHEADAKNEFPFSFEVHERGVT